MNAGAKIGNTAHAVCMYRETSASTTGFPRLSRVRALARVGDDGSRAEKAWAMKRVRPSKKV